MKLPVILINFPTILRFVITAFVLYFTLPITVYAESVIDTDNAPKYILHHVPWRFDTYNQPNFKALKTNSFNPQTVTIIETSENGWALINTYNGEQWFYINDNLRFIENTMTLFESKYDEVPIASLSSQIVKIIEEDDNWLLIDTWLGLKWVDLLYIRPFIILDVPTLNQRHLGYPTGCEIVALCMMINHCIEVDIETLVSQMPLSTNPEEGFVGNPTSKSGFTIFPSAMSVLIDEYIGNSYDMSGCSIEDLKQHLNMEIPIVAWVNGLGFNVHAICLTGYDEEGFYYNDPWTGEKNSFITYDDFYLIWNKPIFYKQLNIYYSPRMALSYYSIQNKPTE